VGIYTFLSLIHHILSLYGNGQMIILGIENQNAKVTEPAGGIKWKP
jgi:hypothetical protein